MADRADDIKQLFSHLGLDPGGYQELRTRGRAETSASRVAPPAAAAPAAAPVTVAPPPALQPPSQGAALAAGVLAAAAAPAAAASMATRAAAAAAAPPPASVPAAGGESGRRWSLLRAAVESSPKVALIRPELRPAVSPPPAVAVLPPAPPLAASPAAKPAAAPAITVNLATADDERPTHRLFQELQRAPEETTRRLAGLITQRRAADPLPVAAPAEPETIERPAASPAMPARALPPEPARAVAPAPVPVPVMVELPAPVVERSRRRDEGAAAPNTPLMAAFRRLGTPQRAPTAREIRLRLPYAPRPEREPVEEAVAPQALDQVFARLSKGDSGRDA